MAIAEYVAICGPLIAATGAGILAIDALKAPVHWYDQVFFPRGWIKAISRMHASTLRTIQSYSSPPYTTEQIKEFEDKSIADFKKKMEEAESDQDTKELKERFKSQKRAVWGFALVFIGSLLQAIAVIMK